MRGRIILASASPRRRELLESACFEVEVRPSNADETWPAGSFEEGAIAIAKRKLQAVRFGDDQVAVAADTIVCRDDEALGKPKDADGAFRMLRSLAGITHRVITGYCVRRGARSTAGAVSTEVRFRALEDAEIRRYIATGEPFDKAGGYGIQGAGGALVASVHGSYTNVVGLPLDEVIAVVKGFG